MARINGHQTSLVVVEIVEAAMDIVGELDAQHGLDQHVEVILEAIAILLGQALIVILEAGDLAFVIDPDDQHSAVGIHEARNSFDDRTLYVLTDALAADIITERLLEFQEEPLAFLEEHLEGPGVDRLLHGIVNRLLDDLRVFLVSGDIANPGRTTVVMFQDKRGVTHQTVNRRLSRLDSHDMEEGDGLPATKYYARPLYNFLLSNLEVFHVPIEE